MILKTLLRLLFVAIVSAFAVNAYAVITPNEEWNQTIAGIYAAIAAVVAVALVLFEWRFQRQIVRELVAVAFGLATGLIVTLLIMLIAICFFLPSASGDVFTAFSYAFSRVQPVIPLLLCGCCYIGVTVVLGTRDDFRFLLPYIDFSQRGTQEGGFILDTSAIIDGRIADVCTTSIIGAPLIIPDFVIRELQTIADSSDRLKRLRGRRGLDIVGRLRKMDNIRVSVRQTDAPLNSPVDLELVRCAKELNGRIVTTDFNLNKVSQIEGLSVINVNDLANALKPAVLPGERLTLKIIRAGQEPGQGVGYLEDGTMVVVDDARPLIGQTVTASITGSIQTSAGRMIFGRIEDKP